MLVTKHPCDGWLQPGSSREKHNSEGSCGSKQRETKAAEILRTVQHSDKYIFFFSERLHVRRSLSTGLEVFYFVFFPPNKALKFIRDGFLAYWKSQQVGSNMEHLQAVWLHCNTAAGFSPNMRWNSWAASCQDDFLVWKTMAILFTVMLWNCVILLRLCNKQMLADGLVGMLSAPLSGVVREIRLWHAHSGGLRKNY